jgi:hypothetical protein
MSDGPGILSSGWRRAERDTNSGLDDSLPVAEKAVKKIKNFAADFGATI